MRTISCFLFAFFFLALCAGFAEVRGADDSSWCNTLSFQETFVEISRGRTETFVVKVVCPEAMDLGKLSFPQGMSAKAEIAENGLRITLAVPFEKKTRLFREESVEYQFPDGSKRRIVTLKIRRSDADRTSLDFTR